MKPRLSVIGWLLSELTSLFSAMLMDGDNSPAGVESGNLFLVCITAGRAKEALGENTVAVTLLSLK